jgi:hypothetical protein
MSAAKPKTTSIKFGWNVDPISMAAGNLSKALDRFTEIESNLRKEWVEEMKKMPYLTHMNMPVLASTLVLYESIPPSGVANYTDKSEDIISFFKQVSPMMPPKSSGSITGLNVTRQELYDEITRPLLEDITNKELTNIQINDILIKMKATLFRYSVNLYNYRTEE